MNAPDAMMAILMFGQRVGGVVEVTGFSFSRSFNYRCKESQACITTRFNACVDQAPIPVPGLRCHSGALCNNQTELDLPCLHLTASPCLATGLSRKYAIQLVSCTVHGLSIHLPVSISISLFAYQSFLCVPLSIIDYLI